MLKELYEEKLELFQQLEELTTQMAQFSSEMLLDDDSKLTDFQNLLHERQQLMHHIDKLDLKIQASCEGEGQCNSANLKKAIRESALLIEQQNAVIESTIKTTLAQLRKQTRKLREGRQTKRAYAGRVLSSEGSFIDKRR